MTNVWKVVVTHWRRIRLVEFLAISLLIGLAAGLIFNWRWIRGHEEFRWRRYLLPGMDERLWVTVLVCLIAGALTYGVASHLAHRPSSRRKTIGASLFLFLAALVVQLGLLYLEHPQPISTLFYRTISTRNLGAFFYDASRITDVDDHLRRFPERMPQFEASSPRTHPPGLQLIFWMSAQLLARWPALAETIGADLRLYICAEPSTAVFQLPNAALAASIAQIAMPIWSALTVLPFFGLARRLFGEQSALRGASLLIVVPSLVLFAAHWDHFYALIGATSLYVAHLGLESRRGWPLLIAGVLISIATFLSFGNLALIFLVLVYTGAFWLLTYRSARAEPTWSAPAFYRTVLVQGVAYGSGVVSIWAIYFLAYGVIFSDVFSTGLALHAQITGYRTYWVWIGYNLFDFFLFLGIPIVLPLVQTFGNLVVARSGQPRLRLSTIPVWAFAITLIVLDLSGAAKGEIARLWQFLIPLAVLAALPAIATWSNRRFAVMLAVQMAQLILIAYFVRTIGYTDFLFYTPRPIQTSQPPIAQPIDASLGSDRAIRVLGYDLTPVDAQPGGTLQLTVYWRAERRLPHSYTVFVHVVDEAGRLRAQHDGIPQEGRLPTTCWLDGEIVADTHAVPLDSALPPGTYTVQIGMYRLDLLQAGDPDHRLSIDRNGQIDDHLKLASFSIATPISK